MLKTSSPCSKIFLAEEGGFGGGRRERGVKRGFDLETEIELTLSEILKVLNVRLSTSVSRYATLVKVPSSSWNFT